MSEKIFAWLLRLYPSHFRQAYGDDARQLFRDRARDEQGFFSSLRLWWDLLTDSAVSIPREHYSSPTARIEAPVRQCSDGSLSFHVVGSETPSLGALLLGGILSLVVLGTCSVLISHVRDRPSPGAALVQPRPNEDRSSASRGPASNGAKAAISESGYPTANEPRARIDDKFAGDSQSRLQTLDSPGSPQAQASQPRPTYTTAMMAAAPENVDPEQRHRVIDRAVANLKQYYFDREVGKKTADAMLAHERNGDDKAATQGAALAALLTAQMRDASHDMRLVMDYSRAPLPSGPPV